MIRTPLSLTVLAAAVAASLLATPRLAAQSSGRPAIDQSSAGQDDALHLRRLVNEEALHRDRVARSARLRALAEQRGQRERLSELDRLDRLETERFEARTLFARTHMSEGAQREADEFIKRGGVLKLRRANLDAGRDGQRGATRTGTQRGATQRQATPTRSATRPQSGRIGGSSSGGRSGSGGRSPR